MPVMQAVMYWYVKWRGDFFVYSSPMFSFFLFFSFSLTHIALFSGFCLVCKSSDKFGRRKTKMLLSSRDIISVCKNSFINYCILWVQFSSPAFQHRHLGNLVMYLLTGVGLLFVFCISGAVERLTLHTVQPQ